MTDGKIRIGRTRLLLTFAIAAGAGPAHAQAGAPQSAPDEIVVTASGQSQASSTTKTKTPIIESPQSISIVSREEMDLRAAVSIADALSYTAGVLSEPSGIDSRVDEVSVRGFGAGGYSSNNNFVDGLRLPSGGQWTRPGFDPFALQQIDVLKGPSGALYGQTAPGGVVNIVTKRASPERRFEVMLQGAGLTDLGNWNYQAAADIGGAIDDTLSARVVALSRYGDTQVDQSKIGRRYLSPSLTWQPSDRTTWTILAQYQRDEGGSTYQFLPALGVKTATDGGYIRNDANIGEPGWNVFDRNQYLIGSFVEHRVASRLTLRNNTRFTRLETLYRGVVLSGNTLTTCPATIAGCIPGRTIGRRAVQGIGDSEGIATDTQFEAGFDTGVMRHTLLGGFDYFRTEWSHDRNLVTRAPVLPLLDILNPQARGTAGFEAGLTPQVLLDTVSRQNGIYLQDQIELGKLRVTVGGRQDWARDDSLNRRTERRYVVKSDAFTWRVGGVYLFDNGLAPYASYATSYQPQVNDPTTSVGGVSFVPTTGQQWEAGLRFQQGRAIYVTLGAYQITQQNIVTPDPNGTMCGTSICQIQTGEGRVRGVELEGKASLPWGMAIIGAVTRTDGKTTRSTARFEDRSIVGNALPQVPEWLASLFVDQRITGGPLAGFGMGGGARYTGRSYGDSNNVFRMTDYTLFDLFFRYDPGIIHTSLKGMTVSINARNIRNTRYVATCAGSSACYYGQGRSVTARIGFRW